MIKFLSVEIIQFILTAVVCYAQKLFHKLNDCVLCRCMPIIYILSIFWVEYVLRIYLFLVTIFTLYVQGTSLNLD